MWNQFLNESRSERKFENTPVIILGNKHSGKRSLVDTLFDISKTTLYTRKLSAHTDTNKMKLRGLSPIIDYAYLNVLDIVDPDYRTSTYYSGTHCKLEAYMVEDKLDYHVFSQLQKPEILKKAIVIIMLDFTTPWTFMQKLDYWINFLYELQKRAGLSIVDL